MTTGFDGLPTTLTPTGGIPQPTQPDATPTPTGPSTGVINGTTTVLAQDGSDCMSGVVIFCSLPDLLQASLTFVDTIARAIACSHYELVCAPVHSRTHTHGTPTRMTMLSPVYPA